MSNVAHRVFAPAPSGSSFEGLTKRLLALRAEIDAILAELTSQAMAMQRAEATAALLAQELSPILSGPLTDGESMRERAMVEDAEAASEPSAGEHATSECLEPSEIVDLAVPEQPIADATALEPVEVEPETPDHVEQIADAATPIAVIDADPALQADATSQCPEAEASPTADMSAATEAVSAEQPGDAAILEAPQHASAESTRSEEALQQPAALVDTGIPAMPVAAAGENLPAAAVIGIHTRQRKQKGELVIRAPRPARSSRHLAAKIAACILVLLTAATILVLADRTAMGSVQSFPWMSPMTGAAATDQALQSDQRVGAPASDDAATTADVVPLADGIFLLQRYRETWPSGS